jgi:hypothetical protein
VSPERAAICAEVVSDLEARGVLSSSAAASELARCGIELGAPEGFFTFVGVLWVIAGILLLAAVAWLGALYVVPWIRRLPAVVRELAFHSLCLGGMFMPSLVVDGGGATAIAFAACLGWTGAVGYTHRLRFSGSRIERSLRLWAALLCAGWAASAIVHGSAAIGFLAALAYGWWIGVVIIPVVDWVHFDRTDVVPIAMAAAALLLVTFAGLDVAGVQIDALAPHLDVFRTGALIVGGAVWFAGCLVLASKRYRYSPLRFWSMQAFAVGSAITALFVGTVYDFAELSQSGGTFLACYAVEKLIEVKWKERGYAWMVLGLAAIAYAVAAIAERHPNAFLGLP